MTTTEDCDNRESLDSQWKAAQEKYNATRSPKRYDEPAPPNAGDILSEIENRLLPNLVTQREDAEKDLFRELERVADENTELSDMINLRAERIRELHKEYSELKERYAAHCKREIAKRPPDVEDTPARTTDRYGGTWWGSSNSRDWKTDSHAGPHSGSWSRSSQRYEDKRSGPERATPRFESTERCAPVVEPDTDEFKPKWANWSVAPSGGWNEPSYEEKTKEASASDRYWTGSWETKNTQAYSSDSGANYKWSNSRQSETRQWPEAATQETQDWRARQSKDWSEPTDKTQQWGARSDAQERPNNDWYSRGKSDWNPEKKDWITYDRSARSDWHQEGQQEVKQRKSNGERGGHQASYGQQQRAPEVDTKDETPSWPNEQRRYGWTRDATEPSVPAHIAARFSQRRRDIPPPPASGMEYVASNSWGGSGALS